VVSALTLVSEGARREYPWLHESVYEPPAPRNIVYEVPANRFDWIHRLFGARDGPIPLLELPPPHEDSYFIVVHYRMDTVGLVITGIIAAPFVIIILIF
jgi:hypothetical protein